MNEASEASTKNNIETTMVKIGNQSSLACRGALITQFRSLIKTKILRGMYYRRNL